MPKNEKKIQTKLTFTEKINEPHCSYNIKNKKVPHLNFA